MVRGCRVDEVTRRPSAERCRRSADRGGDAFREHGRILLLTLRDEEGSLLPHDERALSQFEVCL